MKDDDANPPASIVDRLGVEEHFKRAAKDGYTPPKHRLAASLAKKEPVDVGSVLFTKEDGILEKPISLF
jgi:hypothetical protein